MQTDYSGVHTGMYYETPKIKGKFHQRKLLWFVPITCGFQLFVVWAK